MTTHDEAVAAGGTPVRVAPIVGANDALTIKEQTLRHQIQKQIAGFAQHLENLTYTHRRVETNTRRALGHAQEAIRLSMKLRRLRSANANLSGTGHAAGTVYARNSGSGKVQP